MTTENQNRLKVIVNDDLKRIEDVPIENNDYQTNPIYQKLLNFRNLQDAQKKRFSVDDLFKLC